MARGSFWSFPPLLPMAALAAVALAIATSGWLWYHHERQGLLDEKVEQMAAIAELKASLVGEWLAERQATVEILAGTDEVALYLSGAPAQRAAVAGRIEPWLAAPIGHREVSNAALVDRDGTVLRKVRSGPFSFRELQVPVLEQGRGAHSSLHRHDPADGVHLTFGAPVHGPAGAIVGAVGLRVEAEGFLFSIVRQWPGGEATGEALLVAFEGDDAVILSGARLTSHQPLSVHMSPEALLLPGTAAYTPAAGVGLDYRREPVVMALAPVPQTRWMVLAKTDLAEALHPALGHALTVVGISGAAVLAAVLLLALWWRRHQRQVLAAELDARVKQREAERRVETLAEASHDAVFVLDEQMRIVDVNDRAVERYGYAREELLQLRISDLRAPETSEQLLGDWEASVAGTTFETVHMCKDGRRIPVEVSTRGFDAAGRTWRFSQARDISRRKADAELTAYHAMLLQNLREAVIATDADNRIRAWNGGAERIFGYRAGEVLGRHILQVRPRLVGTTPQAILERVLKEPEVDVAFRATRPDGTEVQVEFRLLARRDGEGRVQGFVGVGRDVTQRRLLEQRLQLALEGTGDGLWDLDTRSDRVWVSPAWVAKLGLPGELAEAGVEPLHSLFYPADPAHKKAVTEHLQGLAPRYEYELRLTLGDRPCWVAVRGKVVEAGPDGEPRRLAGTFTDVTDRKAFQGRLVAADRLSSMGSLAAGLAHEINNPLAYVVSNVTYAHEVLAPVVESGEPFYGPEARDAMKALLEAVEGSERVRKIVQDLKTFSRTDGDEKGLVDVRESLRMALSMARGAIKHRASVETDFAEVPLVEAAEHRLGQVFLNLVVNAAQAIPEGRGGRDVIRVATRTFGRSVVVEVQDTGCGMSPEVLSHLFEPFYTTKPAGAGTGLGLSICHGIVSGMGGRIEVESSPGKGSTFRVLLPASARVGPSARPEVARAALPAGAGRILVVDGEAHMGPAFRRILSPPHAVVHETSIEDAIARLEAREPVDLVLCDLAAEGDVDELRATLALRRPGGARRFALLSAGTCGDGARALLESGLPVIEKPFQPAAVRALVARLLAEVAPAPEAIAPPGMLAPEPPIVQHEAS